MSEQLLPLPPHADDAPWPGEEWPEGPLPDGVDLGDLLDLAFEDDGPVHQTFAVVVVHRGRVVAERYQGSLEHFDRPPDVIDRDTPLLSWSMAKSVLHAAIGILVGEGRLDLDSPAPVPEWSAPGDPRGAITLRHLLEMRDGLDFSEDYVDGGGSDVIEMLFGSGAADVAAFAGGRGMVAEPGERFSYSSGTTNIVAGILGRVVGKGHATAEWLSERLFGPIGARSATLGFDDARTWVASSYLHMTARDYACFGELYLRDGIWDGHRVLPKGWVDYARTPRSADPDESERYGAHWWVADDRFGTFRAVGYEGQSISVSPALDLVVVRLGKTPEERSEALRRWRGAVVQAFAAASG